jgi:hypothetical protein
VTAVQVPEKMWLQMGDMHQTTVLRDLMTEQGVWTSYRKQGPHTFLLIVLLIYLLPCLF